MLKKITRLVLAFPLVLSSGAGFGQEIVATAAVVNRPAVIGLCIACHGENGVGVSDDIPALAGQHEQYMVDRLKRFSRPGSGSEVMQGIAATLDEATMREAARYFAALPYLRKKQTLDADKVQQGKAVYAQLCQLCHAAGGRSTPYVEYPLLAGQTLAYLQKTTANMLAGQRGIDEMKESMISLLFKTPERLDAALYFFASQEVDPALMVSSASDAQKLRRRRFRAAP